MQYAAEKSRTGRPALLLLIRLTSGFFYSQQRPHGRFPRRPASISVALFAAAAAQRVLAAVIAFVAANAAAPVPAVAGAARQTAAAAVMQAAAPAVIAVPLRAIAVILHAVAAILHTVAAAPAAAGLLTAADLLLAAAFFAAADAIGTRTALFCGRRGVPTAALPALPAAAPVFAEQDAIQ